MVGPRPPWMSYLVVARVTLRVSALNELDEQALLNMYVLRCALFLVAKFANQSSYFVVAAVCRSCGGVVSCALSICVCFVCPILQVGTQETSSAAGCVVVAAFLQLFSPRFIHQRVL